MEISVETSSFAAALKQAKAQAKDFGLRLVAEDSTLRVEAVNRDVSYRQVLSDVEVDRGGSVVVKHNTFAGTLERFPVGTRTTLRHDPKEDRLNVECDGVTAVFAVPPPESHYPKVSRIAQMTDDDLIMIEDFSTALTSVAFAAERKADAVLSGVRIDGEFIAATDKYKAARTVLRVPVDSPITIPSALVGSLVPKRSEVAIGAGKGRFLMRPDIDTEIVAMVLAGDYPDIHRLWGRTEHGSKFVIEIDDLAGAMSRAKAISDSDEAPKVQVHNEGEEMHIVWRNSEGDSLEDALPISRLKGEHDFNFMLSPDVINGILNQNRTGGGTAVMEPPQAGVDGFIRFDCSTGLSLVAAPRIASS